MSICVPHSPALSNPGLAPISSRYPSVCDGGIVSYIRNQCTARASYKLKQQLRVLLYHPLYVYTTVVVLPKCAHLPCTPTRPFHQTTQPPSRTAVQQYIYSIRQVLGFFMCSAFYAFDFHFFTIELGIRRGESEASPGGVITPPPLTPRSPRVGHRRPFLQSGTSRAAMWGGRDTAVVAQKQGCRTV